MGINVKSMSSVPVCVTNILGLRLWNFDVVGGCCNVAMLFYGHGKHLRSCRDGQLT